MGDRIVIIGAGGHAKVVSDAVVLQKKYELIGFTDMAVPVGSEVINGYRVISTQDDLSALEEKADYFIVAIGKNEIRAHLFSQLRSRIKPATVIHPSAVIGSGVSIGDGTVVLANAVVNTNAEIGENSIINCRVVVDHDCRVGANVHLSIGTMLGSNSVVSDYYLSKIGENMNAFSKLG